ncbi:MAG: RNase P subunit p30 family protein [Promethearchaeota archaeon]
MYFNSCIPWNADEKKFRTLVDLTYQCGYQGAFVDFSTDKEYRAFLASGYFPKKRPQLTFPLSISSLPMYRTDNSPLVILPRITLEPKNTHALKSDLAKWVDKRCIISVQSTDKTILEVAARDGRVDMISLPSMKYFKDLSKGIYSLIKQNRIFIDIHFGELLMSYGNKRTRLLRNYYKIFKQAKPFSHRYIFGSGLTRSDKTLWNLSGPREIGAILTTLLGIPEKHVKMMVRDHTEQLALLFIKRDQHTFIEPGVEIVDRKNKEDEE